MNELRECADRWLAEHIPSVRISVIQTQGSTPQASGAQMLVSANQIAGTIGGGNLEWQAIARARELLLRGTPVLLEENRALGPNLGQCCGGIVKLQYQDIDARLLADWPDQTALFDLHLFGMGHVAEALVQVLSAVHCVIHWYDEREEIYELRFQQWHNKNIRAQLVLHGEGTPRVDRFSRTRFALIMTHSHALDFDLVRALMIQSGFGFIGLIGSESKRRRFLRKLEQTGLAPDQTGRLTCPIGQVALKFKQPELLAISIAAQLLQLAQSGKHTGITNAALEAVDAGGYW